MSFLIVQKQREEKNAQLKLEQQTKLKIARQAELDKLSAATPSANIPVKGIATVTPMASPSDRPTSGSVPQPKTVKVTTTP